MNFDRRGNFRGAVILLAQEFYRRGDFNVGLSSILYYQPHEFCMSAGVFRSNFPQQFSAGVFRSNFPPEF
jgi:hypothetical protein